MQWSQRRDHSSFTRCHGSSRPDETLPLSSSNCLIDFPLLCMNPIFFGTLKLTKKHRGDLPHKRLRSSSQAQFCQTLDRRLLPFECISKSLASTRVLNASRIILSCRSAKMRWKLLRMFSPTHLQSELDGLPSRVDVK